MDLATRYRQNNARALEESGKSHYPANDKQTPECFIITCMDNRADLHALFGLQHGEAVIMQFAGPIVPVYDPACSAAQSFHENLHLAIHDMKVRSLSLLGHSGCRTARKLSENLYSCGDIPWLKKLSGKILQNAMIATNGDDSPGRITREIERQIIIQGIKNLFDYPAIEKAIHGGLLTVEGLQLDRQTGNLLKLNTDGNSFSFDIVAAGHARTGEAAQSGRVTEYAG